MARKKIVYVIVEGPSDEEALSVILSRIYDKETVYVEILHKDITSEYGVSPTNIVSKVGNVIRKYAKDNNFVRNDFRGIIHIVDMDGAYIPDSNVLEDASAVNPIYSLTAIRTYNKEGIELRNKQKRDNINKLCSGKKIWDTPYRVFYMSCNLDHVLYNKLNSSDEEKKRDSYNFAKKFKDNTQDFLIFISDSDFSVVSEYKESWEFIRQDLHSLERYTNLGLCFREE